MSSLNLLSDTEPKGPVIVAGEYLPPYQVGDLPDPPRPGWRLWIGLIGPGIVLAGTSIGSGEWLFGPAVTAQYGAALLWLALLSILFQAFCNLTMMRYTVYSGEPIIVGGLRTWPGPGFWVACYAVLDIASIWPYNASNAAVPLAAVVLGRLPQSTADQALVRVFGFAIFLLAFVPLVFGGTVYRMLERIMTAKLVLVLGYLSLIAATLVSWPVIRRCVHGLFPVRDGPAARAVDHPRTAVHTSGTARQRALSRQRHVGARWPADRRPLGRRGRSHQALRPATRTKRYLPWPRPSSTACSTRPGHCAKPHHFFVETEAKGAVLSADGEIVDHHLWKPARLTVRDSSGLHEYFELAAVPGPLRGAFSATCSRTRELNMSV